MKYRVGASAFVLSLSLISSNAYADEHKVVEDHSAIELSANVAIVSDYVFRGITQSDEILLFRVGLTLIMTVVYTLVYGFPVLISTIVMKPVLKLTSMVDMAAQLTTFPMILAEFTMLTLVLTAH